MTEAKLYIVGFLLLVINAIGVGSELAPDYTAAPYRAVSVDWQTNDQLEAMLDRHIDIDFRSTILTRALKGLAKSNGFEWNFDTTGIKAANADLNVPVTLRANQIRLRSALALLLRGHSLQAVPVRERLTLVDNAEASQWRFTRVYPVADLVTIASANGVDFAFDDLKYLIQNAVDSDTWTDNGANGSIHYLPSAMAFVIEQTLEVHHQIGSLLVQLRIAKENAHALIRASGIPSPNSAWRPQIRSFAKGAAIETGGGPRADRPFALSPFQRILASRISVNFDQTPLSEAVQMMRDRGIPIDLHESSLTAKGVSPHQPVTLRFDGMRVDNVVSWLAQRVKCEVDDYGPERISIHCRSNDGNSRSPMLPEQRYDIGMLTTLRHEGEWLVDWRSYADYYYDYIDYGFWQNVYPEVEVRCLPEERQLVVRSFRVFYQSDAEKLVAFQTAKRQSALLAGRAGFPKFDQLAMEQYREAPSGLRPLPVAAGRSEFNREWIRSLPAARPLVADEDLDQWVTAVYESTPLLAVIDDLRTQVGCNIVVDREGFEIAKVTVDRPMTARFNGVRLRDVLAEILGPLGLKAVVEDDVILITDDDKGSRLIRRVYPVADIVAIRGLAPKALARRLTAIHPDRWAGNGGTASIDAFAPAYALVIVQTEDEHEFIEEQLGAIRRSLSLVDH